MLFNDECFSKGCEERLRKYLSLIYKRVYPKVGALTFRKAPFIYLMLITFFTDFIQTF